MLASALLTFTRKSTQVSDVLASAQLIFTHKSPPRTCYPSARHSGQAHSGQACHCGTVLFSWRSRPACVSLTLPQGVTSSMHRTPTVGLVLLVGQYPLGYCNMSSRTGLTLYAFLSFCGSSSCSTELVLANRRHILNKSCVIPYHRVKVT